MPIKKNGFSTKPNHCSLANLREFSALNAKQQSELAVPFLTMIAAVLDEAAGGEDLYMTLGTTRDKSSFTASISVAGNRESVYESTVQKLIAEFTQLLSHLLDPTSLPEEEELLEDDSEFFDEPTAPVITFNQGGKKK